MKKSARVKKLFVLLVWFAITKLSLAQQKKEIFYVSPSGNDNNTGVLEKPFASLGKAISIAQGKTTPVEIIVREGTYHLSKPILIQRSNLTIKAYLDEKPVLSGGRLLTGQWQSAGHNRWRIKVPHYFRQLFVDGKRATRARFPNAGSWTEQWFQPDTIQLPQKRIVLNKSLPSWFSELKGVEMHATAWWHYLRQKVDSFVPAENAVITVTEPSPESSSRKIDKIDRIHFENNIAFLDMEGEWFVDSLTNTLYYQSLSKPNQQFIYPALECLIECRGSATKPLVNVHIEGIKVHYTEWEMPDTERKSIQAGFWGTQLGQPVYAPKAALMFSWTLNSSIKKCSFSNLGEGAIALADGCKNNIIDKNNFYDIGSNVIQVGWRSGYIGTSKLGRSGKLEAHPLCYEYENDQVMPGSNVISNNRLTKFCTTDRSGVGIWIGNSGNNKVINNLLEDFSYTGISVGWRWDTLKNTAQNNLVEWNEIRNGMQYLSDGGGIYTAGRQQGTRILNNWVSDIGGGPVLGEGIYLDEGSSYLELAHNYVERTKSLSYKFHRNLISTLNVHGNNNQQGKQTVTQFKAPTVGTLEVKDASPRMTERFGNSEERRKAF